MTTKPRTWATLFAAALLFACGGEEEGGEAEGAMAQATEAVQEAADEMKEAAGATMEAAGETMEMAEEAMAPSEPYEIVVIDHSKDEQEFRIKKSLAGVESLIEDVKAAGGDVSDLEAQKADLEKQLESL
jgi:hypothetical protein